MTMTTNRIGGALAALFLSLQAVAALATPINLDTGIALDVDPGTTGTATLSATNFANGTQVTNWNAWTVALQLLPNPGATGTMTISGISPPATNGSLANPDAGTFDPSGELFEPANGATAYTAIGFANNTNAVTTWASGQQFNLAGIAFTASGDASGSWTLYAVNQSDTEYFSTTNYFNAVATPFAFGNSPATNGSSLVLGTITAVPEPGSLTLAAAAGVVGLLALRRRQRLAGVRA